jgi:60 kDa SS-A/Ro ribonucleoprotein
MSYLKSQAVAPGKTRDTRTFKVDKWTRLDRFLMLGTESATYYASEGELTFTNVLSVEECLAEDYTRAINRIVDISEQGRAPKNEPALYALAMAASVADGLADNHIWHLTGTATRAYALARLPKVARTGTHLLHFVSYAESLRGWGRGLKSAVARWFLDKSPEDLFYQVMKYRQRDGWSMRDLLRLSHPDVMDTFWDKTRTNQYNLVFEWVTKGWPDAPEIPVSAPTVVRRIGAFETLQKTKQVGLAAEIINQYNLPREAVPTELLTSPVVWQALIPNLGITALIRNLPTLTRVGLLTDRNLAVGDIVERLTNQAELIKGRVHPLNLMVAALTYGSGRSLRGSSTWTPNPEIVTALNNAFYLAFKAAVPTGKRILLALDVSGSMGSGAINGVPGLTPRRAAAAMSLVTVNIEQNTEVVCFSGDGGYRFADSTAIKPFPIDSTMRLDQVVQMMDDVPFGSTNPALPVLYALEHNIRPEVFYILTDSEANTGRVTASQALESYRQKTGIKAKMVVSAFTANDISVADPNDPLCLDICGLDSAVPALISDFIKGDLFSG